MADGLRLDGRHKPGLSQSGLSLGASERMAACIRTLHYRALVILNYFGIEVQLNVHPLIEIAPPPFRAPLPPPVQACMHARTRTRVHRCIHEQTSALKMAKHGW